jgi:putative transcriptional regulator
MTMHHPDHSWLEQYAAGTLSMPVAISVATHLHFCADCRRQIELLQSVGGALFEQLAPVPVSDEILARVLTLIETSPAVAAASGTAISGSATSNPVTSEDSPAASDEVPAPLRRLIPAGYDALKWSRLLPRMRMTPLKTGDRAFQSMLHRVQPGGGVPSHDHRGLEFTVVLRGSFSDERGVYGPGDFLQCEPGIRHRPVAALNGECLCLTVQQAPIRFTGLLWRWLNPLLR